jgi:TorA maturation chaperone TorD
MNVPFAPTPDAKPIGLAPRLTAPRAGNAGSVQRHRAMLYMILAQGLSTPTEPLCQALADDTFWAILRYALDGAPGPHRRRLNPALADGAPGPHRRRLDPALAAPPIQRNSLEALLIEHTRLFGTDLICAHYEADYVAAGSFRLVHVLADVSAMYAAFGVRVSDAAHERADHVVIELDFMNFLATKEAHAARLGRPVEARLCRRAQRLFFRRHLGCWGRAFAGNFGAAAHVDFYQRLPRLLEALIVAEAEYLAVRLADIEVKRETDAQVAAADGQGVCGHCQGHR